MGHLTHRATQAAPLIKSCDRRLFWAHGPALPRTLRVGGEPGPTDNSSHPSTSRPRQEPWAGFTVYQERSGRQAGRRKGDAGQEAAAGPLSCPPPPPAPPPAFWGCCPSPCPRGSQGASPTSPRSKGSNGTSSSAQLLHIKMATFVKNQIVCR